MAHRHPLSALCILAVSGSLALAPVPMIAQTASQVTPPTEPPPTTPIRGSLRFSGSPGLAAPPGAERLSIRIADVRVEGTLPGMEVPTEALRQRLTRGRIQANELFEGAAELEQAYINEGFVLARVVIPQQQLNDGGTLRLQVIDGFVEEVDAQAAPDSVRGRLAGLTDPLVGQRGVTLSEIERQILLAGDTYGVALGSALQAGATPGGTVIVLDPQYKPVTGFLGFDNSLSDNLGDWKFDAGLELNGLLGFGESIYFRLSGHPDGQFFDEPVLRTFSLGAIAPIGNDGLTINLEGTNSQTNPEEVDPDVPSDYERVSLRLFYPWIRSRAFNVTTQLAFDSTSDELDVETASGDLPIYEDDLRILRIAGDLFWLTEQGSTVELGAELSFGLDAFGARTAEDAEGGTPLSRPGADADFTKLVISGRYRTPVAEDFELRINGRAQTSFGDPLTISEQFGVASAFEISPFDAGTLNGDSGWIARGEFGREYITTAGGVPLSVAPYVFAAVGAVYLEEPGPNEQGTTNTSAYGIGVDLFTPFDEYFSNAGVRIELGRGLRDDDEDDQTALSVSANYRF